MNSKIEKIKKDFLEQTRPKKYIYYLKLKKNNPRFPPSITSQYVVVMARNPRNYKLEYTYLEVQNREDAEKIIEHFKEIQKFSNDKFIFLKDKFEESVSLHSKVIKIDRGEYAYRDYDIYDSYEPGDGYKKYRWCAKKVTNKKHGETELFDHFNTLKEALIAIDKEYLKEK